MAWLLGRSSPSGSETQERWLLCEIGREAGSLIPGTITASDRTDRGRGCFPPGPLLAGNRSDDQPAAAGCRHPRLRAIDRGGEERLDVFVPEHVGRLDANEAGLLARAEQQLL